MSHTCAPPHLTGLTEDSENWCCSACGQWWTVSEPYCYECGRSGPPEWTKTSAPVQGPEDEDGAHWLNAPPPLDMSELFEIKATRGGIRYGQPAPPPPVRTWLERDAEIKQKYTRRAEKAARFETVVAETSSIVIPGTRHTYEETDHGVHLENGIVIPGGWCAPTESIYDL